MAFTLDDGLNGLLDTLSARRDGADDDLTAWIDEIGPTTLGELATTDEGVWTYFELLASDGSDEALEFIADGISELRHCQRLTDMGGHAPRRSLPQPQDLQSLRHRH